MGMGIMELTKPEQMRFADCEKNFACRSATLAQIRSASKTRVEDAERSKEEGAAKINALLGESAPHKQEDEPEPAQDKGPRKNRRPSTNKKKTKKAKPNNEDPLEGGVYHKNKDMMLSVLEPYCDILEALTSKRAEKLGARFSRVTKLSDADLKAIRLKLGVAAATVKVFSPADATKELQLPAFIGPESYGKSTLINHIVGRGEDSNIMPADPGMGTQVVCKIAPGPESLRLASDRQGSRQGKVREMISDLNQRIKAKSDRGELGIRDMDMILGQKEFYPPVRMEFLDVPGIKESTAFHTSLALSMATCLVLVCGTLEHLDTQLEDGGDLYLLTDLVQELDEPLPIQCVVSYKVEEKYFNDHRDGYVKLLGDKFPRCEIRDPLWMDFMGKDEEGNPWMSQHDKEMKVDEFMNAVATGSERVVDPYKKFLACSEEVDKFGAALHGFIEKDLLEYQSQADAAMTGLAETMSVFVSGNGKKVDSRLKKSMAFNVNDFLREVKSSDSFPTFQVGVASEVTNPVTIAAALLVDCRLAEMHWLLTQGKELHDLSFGEVYGPVSELCGVSDGTPEQQEGLAKIFVQRVSEAYEMFNTQDDGRLKKDEDIHYWMRSCCKIAPYLNTAPFTWFITGFHLIAGDSKNKHALMAQIQKQRTHPKEWNFKRVMSDHLKDIKVASWVQRCAGKKGKLLKDTQFEVMHECCEAFQTIAEASHFLDDVKDNECLEELLEFTFVMAERILCKKKNDDSMWVWTDFARWMRKNAPAPHELKAKRSELSKAEPAEVADLCNEALDLMRSSACSIPEWRQKMEDDIPDRLETLSACSKQLQASWSPSSESGAAFLISYAVKDQIKRGLHPDTAEIFQELTSGTNCHVALQDAPGPKKEESFPASCFDFVSRVGMHVAMYMRRPDTKTYDPVDSERFMLEALAKQPNLTCLFVLWEPPSGKKWSVEDFPQWDVSKDKVGSYLRVEVVETRRPFQCAAFLQDRVLPAITTASDDAKSNVDKLSKEVLNMGREFGSEVSDFVSTMQNACNLTSAQFHDIMTKDLRAKKDDLAKKLKIPKNRKDFKFQVPSTVFLGSVPEFTDTGVDRIKVDAAGGPGIETVNLEVVNELYTRSFLFNVMLGQVVHMSRALAGIAFESLFAPLLDEIGSKFFMSGRELQEALGAYVTKEEKSSGDAYASPDQEVKHMRTLLGMITQDNFQHMYAGCVVYMLMPALYATVLPCVFDQDKADASDKAFKHYIAKARSMIGEHDQWAEIRQRLRDTVRSNPQETE